MARPMSRSELSFGTAPLPQVLEYAIDVGWAATATYVINEV